MSDKQAQAIQMLKEQLGMSEEEIKALGLTEEELASAGGFAANKVVSIEIELDDSHRMDNEEFMQLVADGLAVVKGRKTLKEGVLLISSAVHTALKAKAMGL